MILYSIRFILILYVENFNWFPVLFFMKGAGSVLLSANDWFIDFGYLRNQQLFISFSKSAVLKF